MSFTHTHSRVAHIATENRRIALAETLVERLCVLILAAATLYILVGDTPFSRSEIDHSTEISPINRYVWLTLLALAVPVLWLRLRAAAALLLAGWPMLVLFGWFALSTSWALDPAAAVRRVLLYVVMLVIFVAVTAGLRRPHLAHRTMAICAGLVVLVDLASWPAVPGIAMTDLGFAGMHAQKNVTGEIALFAALATATCLLQRPRPALRAVLATLLAGALIVLVASRSTTSLVLAIGALAVLPPLTLVLRSSRAAIVIAGAGTLLCLAVALFGYLAWAGITGSDPLMPLRDVTFTERTDLWSFLLDNISQRPFLGSGFGSFWAIDPAVQPSILAGVWFGRGTEIANQGHNAYLDLAATTGLIGLALALGVVLRAIFLAGLATRRGASVFALGFLLVLVVHSMTESSLFTANSVFGSFFLLVAVQVERKEGVLF